MKSFLLLCSLILSSQVFAQDMSRTESFEEAYGGEDDRYIGKCTTHEVYNGVYFTQKKLMQKYVEPQGLSDKEFHGMIKNIGVELMMEIIVATKASEFSDPNSTLSDIIKDYFDDIKVYSLNYPLNKNLNLIQVSYGAGGGNGGYITFNKKVSGSRTSYQVVSDTFDGDVNFCDLKVWKKK